jgi:hypothetical protein
MTHKVIEIIRKQGKMPYLDTTVDFNKSFGEVQALLRKFGCEDIMTRSQVSSVPKLKIHCDLHTIAFVHKGTKFLIEFPVVIVTQGRFGDERKLNMNVSGRIIFNKVKAMLVDVEIEYLTFSQAMMPFRIVAAQDGRPITMQEFVDENQTRLADPGGMERLLIGSGK